MEPAALPATRATLDMIAALDARIVIPGHGEPFTGVNAALDRGYRRTDAYAADDARMARYALKALFAFTLLARRPPFRSTSDASKSIATSTAPCCA